MGFSYSFSVTTASHQHTPLASDGGVLSLTVTRINAFSPLALMVSLG